MHTKGDYILPEKTKITREELDSIYEIEETQQDSPPSEIVETDNMTVETFDEAVERHSKKEREDDLHGI